MPDLVLSMTLPEWNTHNAFLTPRTKSFATSSHLVIDGSYRFYSSVHVDHIERLKLNVDVGRRHLLSFLLVFLSRKLQKLTNFILADSAMAWWLKRSAGWYDIY